MGAALIQDNRPIAFASKTLTDVETRYANIERECLSVVFGLEKFHTYIYGHHITIYNDHKPLEMIQKKPIHTAPPHLQRMLLRLQKYDYNIVYRPGKEMTLANRLSRFPSRSENLPIELHPQHTTTSLLLLTRPISLEELQKEIQYSTPSTTSPTTDGQAGSMKFPAEHTSIGVQGMN